VLHVCKAGTLVGTEKDGEIAGRCDAATTSKETAMKLKVLVDGLKTLGEVRFCGVPAIKKVIGGLRVETRGASITATFKASTVDLEAAAKAMMEQKKPWSFSVKLPGLKGKNGEKKK
jgi:hypothetical protein